MMALATLVMALAPGAEAHLTNICWQARESGGAALMDFYLVTWHTPGSTTLSAGNTDDTNDNTLFFGDMDFSDHLQVADTQAAVAMSNIPTSANCSIPMVVDTETGVYSPENLDGVVGLCDTFTAVRSGPTVGGNSLQCVRHASGGSAHTSRLNKWWSIPCFAGPRGHRHPPYDPGWPRRLQRRCEVCL
jgi:hypothetical protein